MTVTAYCKCNEPVIWQQQIAGIWTTKLNQWVEVTPTQWAYQPSDPDSTVTQSVWRYVCDGVPVPGAVVNWAGASGGTSVPLQTLPTDLTVDENDDVWAELTALIGDLSLLCSGGDTPVWQQNVAGTWTNTTFEQFATTSMQGVWRYSCPDGVSTSMSLVVNPTVGGFATPPTTVATGIGQSVDFGAVCADGSTPIYEFLDYSTGTPVWTVSPPPTTHTTANANTEWRVTCNGVTSQIVSLITAGTTNLNQTVNIANVNDPAWLTLCNECTTGDDLWELQVDNAGWQRLDAADGMECITFELTELWESGGDPAPGAGETLFLDVRHSCDGVTWEQGLITINIT